ncbi:lanthionine synthetase LanC family protein [Catellatospora bangladeshensis]|uniref:Lanthionine synthetase C family protein n=1 Tax=Catellatospora bangladeshensis TaxID=310355 RepID=A0A8J3JMR5_9ACTN|nr:lanthionine synthetase LanC family protein [Catellatospora bangladeshensis]GIF81558.1 hypothetical protein Cba03nite_29070 [Catellatospora bangladeshensis]
MTFTLPLLARMRGEQDLAPLLAWAAEHRAGAAPARLHGGGLAAVAAGMSHAAAAHLRLRPLLELTCRNLAAWVDAQTAPRNLTSPQYDVVSGMAGVVLAVAAAADTEPAAAAVLASAQRWLLERCDPHLHGLRHGPHEPVAAAAWNAGRFNHGLAHGVPGVLAALLAAHDRVPPLRDRNMEAIGRLARHLHRASFTDDRGVLTWARSDADEGRHGHRQAWCYGTPGVAWQLARAGAVLGDSGLTEYAVAAMRSLCAVWDDGAYLDPDPPEQRYAFCHGIPGTMAVAGLFAAHHGLAEAARLHEHLRDRLLEGRRQLPADPTFLAGGGGAAVLLQPASPVPWQLLAALPVPLGPPSPAEHAS